MNLKQTVESLAYNHIEVALDLGVHESCDIDSNCPVAVNLRKIVRESGITPTQLLEGYAQQQTTPPEQLPIELPELDGKLVVSILGKNIEVDVTDALKDDLSYRLEKRRRDIEYKVSELREVGISLYSAYLRQIEDLRKTRTLPQLGYPVSDLLRYDCTISCERDNYLFLFLMAYNPEYIVTGGIRYKLKDEDISSIKRLVFIRFTVSKEMKIIGASILNREGEKFQHYHGRGNDCWGQMKIPARWDRDLRTLSNIVIQLRGALATINRDSIMEREPPGMSHIDFLFKRATKLGEEGHIEERVQPQGTWAEANAPGRGWGRRTNA